MGKYTSLARKHEGVGPQEKGLNGDFSNHIVKINIIDKETKEEPVPPSAQTGTLLRGYAVNAVVRCIHNTTPGECAVCNGYARWLIAGGDERVSRAARSPEAVRQEFWRSVKGAN